MDDMEQSKIELLEEKIEDLRKAMSDVGIDPQEGLTDPLFLFVSSLTPLINVDLLIRDANKGILLSWRDEVFNGRGWHIPGGIIRLRETMDARIQKTALKEIGAKVTYNRTPVMFQEDIVREKREWLKNDLVRSHNISILYDCRLPDGFEIEAQGEDIFPGYLRWFDHYPEDFLGCHERLYGNIIKSIFKESRYDSEIQI